MKYLAKLFVVAMTDPSCAEHARSRHVKSEAHTPEPVLSLLPISILTDSYKTTHFLQYPDSQKMVAVSAVRVKVQAWNS